MKSNFIYICDMTEEFLHYIWKYKLYNPHLQLLSGENLVVLHPGIHNSDSGPDFFNARIKVEETIWAGNIEVHILSSDWSKHLHQNDSTYDNVILHVVYLNDKPVRRKDGSEIPTLELQGLFQEDTWQNYIHFMQSHQWIPCQSMIHKTNEFIRNTWLDSLLVERLERKALEVHEVLGFTQNDWSKTFYWLLARNMGFKLNNQAFEMLAQSLPYVYLLKNSDNLFQLEAIIFGQSGLLNKNFKDDYPARLKNEYDFLRKKYQLTPINPEVWKFMRIHPGNFPTIRLAQFAAIIFHSKALIDRLLEILDEHSVRKLFVAEASEYWENHYRFDQESPPSRKSLGEFSVDLLLINLVAPIFAAYGQHKGNTEMIEKAVDLLMLLKPENNTFTRKWAELGFKANNAASSQSLLELKTHYCEKKKCLSCTLGNTLLNIPYPDTMN